MLQVHQSRGTPEHAARLAAAAFARAEAGEAWLVTCLVEPTEPTLVLGLLQSQRTGRAAFADIEPGRVLRRWSTGPAAMVTGLTIWHALAVPRLTRFFPDATNATLLNRNLRPFLQGYTKAGLRAQYYGRETFALEKRPAAALGYDLHPAGTLLIEALVGIDRPVVSEMGSEQRVTRQLKRDPACLRDIAPEIDPAELMERLHVGFATKVRSEAIEAPLEPAELPPDAPDPATLEAQVETPIGHLERWRDAAGTVHLRADVFTASHAFRAVEALLRARSDDEPDESLLAPLDGMPFEGAFTADLLTLVRP